jgi:hypothetical protein
VSDDDEARDQLERDASVTVEITCASAEAIKVEASKLKPGDQVFDSHGGTHHLVDVRRTNGYVYTSRHDGWEDVFHRADIITIIRNQEV